MNELREVRLKKGMTQAELGKKSGFSGAYISHIENGKRFPLGGAIQRVLDALLREGVAKKDINRIKKSFMDRFRASALS